MKTIPSAKKLDKSNAVVVPAEINKALDQEPRARAIFDKFPPSHCREYIKYITEAKKPETFQRRLDQLVPKLLEKAATKS